MPFLLLKAIQRGVFDSRCTSVRDIEFMCNNIPAFLFWRFGMLNDLAEELNLLGAQGGSLNFWWHVGGFDVTSVDRM